MLQGIMDIYCTTTKNEAHALNGMFHYYRYMWNRRSDVSFPSTETYIITKGKSFLKENIEVSFKDINNIVSDETLLNYPDRGIMFTVHTDAFDK